MDVAKRKPLSVLKKMQLGFSVLTLRFKHPKMY